MSSPSEPKDPKGAAPKLSAPSSPVRPTPPPLAPQGKLPAWSQRYIGREIGFRFTLKKALAAGGLSSIFLGEQTNLSRQVAIKLVRTTEPDMIQRMRQEAQSLAAVNHPGIVEVYDFIAVTGAKASDCYLVMGYVPGLDLSRYLDTLDKGYVPPAEAVQLLLPITSALVELHDREIIHRDIKLSNIIRFVGADGVVRTKLVDFGFARKPQDPSLTAQGVVVGTPAYFAPEIVLGVPHSQASDVYALGVTLCKLLTGESPHGKVALGALLQKAVKQSVALPIWLMQTSLGPLVQSMLKREPEQRPSMREVLRGLEESLESLEQLGREPPPTPGAPPPEETITTAALERRPTARRGLVAGLWLLTILCVTLIGAVVFLVTQWAPRSSPRGASDRAGAPPGLDSGAPHATSARPTAMRPPARARLTPRPMPTPRRRPPEPRRAGVKDLPSVAEIRDSCTNQAVMRSLFQRSRKVILGKRRGDLELARRTLVALLGASCTPDSVRHWVSYYLTMIYVRTGRCDEARRAWAGYARYRQKRGKRVSFPKCP